MPKQPNPPNRWQKMRTAQAMNLAPVERNQSARIGIVANDRIDHGRTADRKSVNVRENDHVVQAVVVMSKVVIHANRVSTVAVIDRRPMIVPADPATVVTNATNMHGRRAVEAIAIDAHDLARGISIHRVVDISDVESASNIYFFTEL